MQRRRRPVSKELQAAIDIQNVANKAAKIESRKPQWAIRAEAHEVRREIKHDAMRSHAARSRTERIYQKALSLGRAAAETAKRRAAILKDSKLEETKTETGIVLPSGAQVGRVLAKR